MRIMSQYCLQLGNYDFNYEDEAIYRGSVNYQKFLVRRFYRDRAKLKRLFQVLIMITTILKVSVLAQILKIVSSKFLI